MAKEVLTVPAGFSELLIGLKKVTGEETKICPCCLYYTGRPNPIVLGKNPTEAENEAGRLSAAILFLVSTRQQWKLVKHRIYPIESIWPSLLAAEDHFPRTKEEKVREKRKWVRLKRLRKWRNRHQEPALIL